MTCKETDWEEVSARLEAAREFLARARADEADKVLLGTAVWSLWSFGEYAVNVVLELEGKPIDRNHRQAELARALFGEGVLKTDYFERLDQLENYRRKATIRATPKNARSTTPLRTSRTVFWPWARFETRSTSCCELRGDGRDPGKTGHRQVAGSTG